MEKNKYIVLHGKANTKEEALQLCGDALYQAGITSPNFAQLCIEREKEYPTGLPTEIPTAIPHAKDEGIKANAICYLKLEKPVAFRRMDDDTQEIYTDMIFNLAIKDPNKHIKALQNMMTFLNNTEILQQLRKQSDEEIIACLQENVG
ncbi:PTS sugar transporter subunit IIA [Catenisphaera adipataccumulans]|jgi:PTS system galactitol-specific IIA component|uniref:PTS system galactitol-specific IIA component n=1 Tax=Catenisphaera adipataccumulans TaxID=700500 RepID=A0A7W8CUZ1_9FIRM|nr:PTS sugar transporter subunit IIA [Catenisphaera adipataccumulans]MBB5182121.1 PTS system galactitol-specific IIA component [Catenisphaera adipataccumulans]